MEASGSGLYIGVGQDYAAGTLFSGLIDDIRIYSRAVEPQSQLFAGIDLRVGSQWKGCQLFFFLHRSPMKSSKSNTKIPVATKISL
ncbi:MAG: hypothetical protein ACYS14_15490 [Planctomycetota bacterium]